MTSSSHHFILLGFENPKFCETLYKPLQVSNLLSNFMEVSVRHEILPLFFGNDVIMTSSVIVELLNLHIL